MKIKIIETGAIETLSIIDPRTGCDWTADLMGNHTVMPPYDDETDTRTMPQTEFDWWADLIERYQAADNRYHSMLSSDYGEDVLSSLVSNVQSIAVDLEYHPEHVQFACNKAIAQELMNGCTADSMEDHERIAKRILEGWPKTEILELPETDRWPETYTWLKYNL